MNDGLDILCQLFGIPATQVGVVDEPPAVRAKSCAKCPFGDGHALTQAEKVQAFDIHRKAAIELKRNPHYAWGCHETAACGITGKTLVCAGFAAWKEIS